MMFTSVGAGYQVDGTERLVLSGEVDKVTTFTPGELMYLIFVLWLYATGRMQS